MRWIDGRKIIFAAALGALALTATLSPARASAEGGVKIPSPEAALGISGMECKCNFTMVPKSVRFYLFQSEPRITGIRSGGPADGKLRAGDEIVAIDGMLIMTRQAGVRFANITGGEAVQITVRRRGRTITETIVADEVPLTDLKIGAFDLSKAEGLERLSKSMESLARLREALPEEGGPVEVRGVFESLHDAGLLGESGPPPVLGWLGFGLSFSGSIDRKPADGGPPRWHFFSLPEVVSVEADGPADRAGLERGDVLTHIDGLALDGGRGEKRFSAIEPGQTITWTVRRQGEEREVVMVAEERWKPPVAGKRPKPDRQVE